MTATAAKTCAVIVWDRRASREIGRIVTRACGCPTQMILTVHGEHIFAVCGRHDSRLQRAFPGFMSRSSPL